MRTSFTSSIFRRTAVMAVITATVFSGIAKAQPRKSASPPNKTPAKVKAGWSGIITYRKTLQDSFNSDKQLFGTVNSNERIKHTTSRSYEYQAKIVVRDLEGTGRANTTANMSIRDADDHKVVQTESTNCHSWEAPRMIKAETLDRKVTEGSGQGQARSYSLSTNGDRFTLSFSLPEFQARYTQTESSSYSNLCPDSTRKPSNSSRSTDTRIPSGGTSVEGKIDPNQPDVITGTKSWTDGTSTIKGFTYTVTWRLRRSPQPLILTDLHFYQPIVPSPTDWREIPNDKWAVDGNRVKVVATVANLGAADKTATVNFRELVEGMDLPDGVVSATIPGNGQKDVEFIWDTSGYAWHSSGQSVAPASNRTIEARIPDDSMTKNIKIKPKPVVLVWGLWQSADAMRKFRAYFGAVTEDWAVTDGMTDVRKVTTDNAAALDGTIRHIQRDLNAWHVDLVGVQNGGLVARVYINSVMPTQFDGRPTATHLAMVGVPNLGTPCASGIYGLSFKLNALNWDAVAELSEDSMKRFNLLVNNTNGTRFAALAIHTRDSVCQADVQGDGLTTLRSAIWRVKTHAILDSRANTREIMGEVAHFRQVYKWIAIPPQGDHSPDPGTLAIGTSNALSGDSFKLAAFDGRIGSERFFDDDTEVKPDASAVATLRPHQPAEVFLQVPAGSKLTVVFMAAPGISARLENASGTVIGENNSNDPAAQDIFRTITVNGPISAGRLKLTLTGDAANDIEIPVTVFVRKADGAKSLS
ncbi:MAG: hypothetical protein IT171_04780 [Acidobacteria bacterium]|nr:hypothetical protein [Acidobacteriota bacterium]